MSKMWGLGDIISDGIKSRRKYLHIFVNETIVLINWCILLLKKKIVSNNKISEDISSGYGTQIHYNISFHPHSFINFSQYILFLYIRDNYNITQYIWYGWDRISDGDLRSRVLKRTSSMLYVLCWCYYMLCTDVVHSSSDSNNFLFI